MKTTYDNPEVLKEIVDYVEAFFVNTDVIIHKFMNEGQPSIVVSTHDTKEFDMVFSGHLDVVHGEEALFEPQIDGSIMRGRGVCDMKSEVAVMLHIVRELASDKPACSIGLMLTTDEEIGGFRGTNYLVNEIGYRARVAIVPDGGGAPDEMVLENKGAMFINLETTGVSAHGSRPWDGENAIDQLIEDYKQIRNLFPEASNDTWTHTCNIGKVSGGQSTNQVPPEACAQLDVRFPFAVDPTELIKNMRDAVSERTSIEQLTSCSPAATAIDDPIVQVYAKVLGDTQGLTIREGRSTGANDGRFFSACGTPLLITRPISGDQHTSDEWLDLDSLVEFYELYKRLVPALVDELIR